MKGGLNNLLCKKVVEILPTDRQNSKEKCGGVQNHTRLAHLICITIVSRLFCSDNDEGGAK